MEIYITLEILILIVMLIGFFFALNYQLKNRSVDYIKIYPILQSELQEGNFYIEDLTRGLCVFDLFFNDQKYYSLHKYLDNFQSKDDLEQLIQSPESVENKVILIKSPEYNVTQKVKIFKIKQDNAEYMLLTFHDISEYTKKIDTLSQEILEMSKILSEKEEILNMLPYIICKRDSRLYKKYYNEMYSNNIIKANLEVQQYERFLSRLCMQEGHAQNTICHVIIGEEDKIFKIEVKPYKDTVTDKVSFLMYGHEITDLHEQSEEASSLKEFVQDILIHSISQGIAIIDVNGDITEKNSNFDTIFGEKTLQHKKEILPNNYFEIIKKVSASNNIERHLETQYDSFKKLMPLALHVIPIDSSSYLKISSLNYLNKYRMLIIDKIIP
ncbi:hypothetical protein GUI12_04370 [Anaplasmataceae bacterium AB001_6]|nr:hypothetical protein GUI12_04370 [Anaplasmataceae bacterium AB001_6]